MLWVKVFSHNKLQNRRIRNWPSKKISMCLILKRNQGFFVIYFYFFPPCVPKHWKSSVKKDSPVRLIFEATLSNISATKTMCKVRLFKWVKLHAKTPIKYPFLNGETFMHFCRKEPGPVLYFCSILDCQQRHMWCACLYIPFHF